MDQKAIPISKEQWAGILRTLLAWVGGQLVGHAIVSENVWTLIAGLVMALATAAYSFFIVHEVTLDAVLGVVRAVIATAGGILEPLGVLPAGSVAQIGNTVLLVLPALWSAYAHRPQAHNAGDGGVGANPAGNGPGGVLSLLLACMIVVPLLLSLTACTPSQIDASVQATCAAKDVAAAAATQAVTEAADTQAQKDAKRAVAYADAACAAATKVSAAYAKAAAQ